MKNKFIKTYRKTYKIFYLVSFLFFTHNLYANQGSVDSLLQQAKSINGTSKKDSLLFFKVLDGVKLTCIDTNSVEYFDSKLDAIKSKLPVNFYYAIKFQLVDNIMFSGANYKAIDISKKLLAELPYKTDPFLRHLYLNVLQELRVPYRNSDKIQDGIAYFLQLSHLAEAQKDSQIATISYYVLRGFYGTLGLIDKAIYYQQKSILFLNPNEIFKDTFFVKLGIPNIGVIGIVNRKSVLASILIDEGKSNDALPLLYQARTIYEKYTDSIYMGDAGFLFTQIVRAKIDLHDDSIEHYLAIAEAFTDSNIVYKAHFYQTKGYYYYTQKNYDSAYRYLHLTEQMRDTFRISIQSFAGVLKPAYYLALVDIETKKYKEAILLLTNEINSLKKGNLRKEALRETKLLSTIYKLSGDYKNAIQAMEQYNEMYEALKQEEDKNRSLSFEVEQSIDEQEKKMEALSVENLYNRRRSFYLTGIALLIGLIAIGIYSRYRAKQKAHTILEEKNVLITREKERNEELLLNILPSEVAEELKETGSAKAKNFALVSVLFTDFKDFTKISESLTPEKLVAEINNYFSYFDNIIHKYGIEKIKTIGDSYMCAGGLPVPNESHAIDVVKAAIEIRDFMALQKKEKLAKGETPFEIRLGIHTGPVVAGIVGIKKFAYDIWGDTVNIASRMESSGAVGKINISGATYEFVKDKFTCNYRGKIDAKNKGEIDMYFIEV